MKILVFNGSPKGDMSDTMHMTNAFVDGMNEVQKNDVQIIHLIDKHIEYCRGCLSCMRNGGECVIHDDMNDLLYRILDSDILIFNYPLYCYGMPACLKAMIDRTLPLGSIKMRKEGDRYRHEGQADYSHLRYVMICGCGFPNSKHNFEPAVAQFNMCFPHDNTIITVPESPMFNVREAEPVTKPRLMQIREAGRQYALNGVIDKDLLEKIISPMIPEELYVKIANGEA